MSTTTSTTAVHRSERRADYEDHGQTIFPGVLPNDLVQRVIPRMDAVIDGEYETGIAPKRYWNPGDDPEVIVKIDQAHLSDRTILELVRSTDIGRCAAEITGADMVQVWVTQVLRKPNSPALGNIGWHQDLFYWDAYWDGEVFTGWVAVSDVPSASAPLRYISGSHRWGLLAGSDFFDPDMDSTRERLSVPPGAQWVEREASMEAGSVSFHDRLTLHGSGPNRWDRPQYTIALHLRTERATPKNGAAEVFGFDLEDTDRFPVIFQR